MSLIACPECNNQISTQAKCCPHCGYSHIKKEMSLIACPECNNQISTQAKCCPHCGYSHIEKEEKGQAPKKQSSGSIVRVISGLFLAGLGAYLGALIGFTLRPNLSLRSGQLSLETIIGCITNPHLHDSISRSTAQTSLTYMIIGAILGIIIGAMVPQLLSFKK